MHPAIFGVGPLGLVGADQIAHGLVGEADAVVAAEAFEHRDVVIVRLADGRAMQRGEMIALAIGIERELPVGLRVQDALLDRHRAVQLDQRELVGKIAQMRRGIDRIALGGAHEDQPEMLGAGQFEQIARADRTIGKARLARLADELAQIVEGPGVERAGNAARLAGERLGLLDQLCAPVGAQVAERADHIVLAADYQDRGPAASKTR